MPVSPDRYHLVLILLTLMLCGCAASPPKQLDNLCDIFEEKPGWHKAAKKSQDKWNTSIPVLMAIMHQESRFQAKARPPRRWFLFIPLGRPSNAYGYAQALDGTWNEYRADLGRRFAARGNFADAIDFIGWYNHRSYQRNNIRRDDAYHLYLAYHEGHGGFNRRTFNNKQWLKDVAIRVSGRSNMYRQQYAQCEKSLNRGSWFF